MHLDAEGLIPGPSLKIRAPAAMLLFWRIIPLAELTSHSMLFIFDHMCSWPTCRWDAWDEKVTGDSETKNWFAANTKPCPKCEKPVEKNGGCNLVMCKCQQVGPAPSFFDIRVLASHAYLDQLPIWVAPAELCSRLKHWAVPYPTLQMYVQFIDIWVAIDFGFEAVSWCIMVLPPRACRPSAGCVELPLAPRIHTLRSRATAVADTRRTGTARYARVWADWCRICDAQSASYALSLDQVM